MVSRKVRLEKTTPDGNTYACEETVSVDTTEEAKRLFRYDPAAVDSASMGSIHEGHYSDIMEAYRDMKKCEEW